MLARNRRLIQRKPQGVSDRADRLGREDRDGTAIRHGAIRPSDGQRGRRGFVVAERTEQFGIIDPKHLSGGCLDIDGEFVRRWIKRGNARPERFGLRKVGRQHRAFGIAEERTVQQHVAAAARGQIREGFWSGRVVDGVEPIAQNSGETDKRFRQRFAAHALDGIAPQAFDMSDHGHRQAIFLI